MSIVCSICGGTGVKCTAVIDPNTRQFLEFTRNALSDGRCSQCGNVALTDPDEVKAGLDKLGRNIRRGIVPPLTTSAATLSGMVITTGVKRRISASEARQTWSRSIRSWPCAATSKSSNHLRSLTRRENLPSWEFKGSSSTTCWKTRPTRSGWTT